MGRSRYIGIKANFTNYSLVAEGSSEYEEIHSDWGDESGGEFIRCACPLCNKELTEHQYKNGKLIEYHGKARRDLSYSLAHKECIEKLEIES